MGMAVGAEMEPGAVTMDIRQRVADLLADRMTGGGA